MQQRPLKARAFLKFAGRSRTGILLAERSQEPPSARARIAITSLPLLPSLESTASSARRLPLLAARPQDASYRPVYAVWELTLRCNLACRHCGSRAGRARPDELTLEEATKLVDELADLGVKEVTLIGGEAYLHEAWLDVVRAIRARDMTCTLTSGGRGITQELAEQAAEAGVQSVSISIDGAAATHDELRGVKGAHASALAAFGHLKKAGIAVAANTQINRKNVAELPLIYEMIRDAGCHGWQVFLTVPMGRATDTPELILQPVDLLDLFPKLEELRVACVESGIRFLPGNNIGYFGPTEKRLREGLRSPNKASCSAGRNVIGIEANGDIKGCPSLPTKDWVGGNIRHASLQDIWERSAELRYTRDMTVESHNWGFCRTCYYSEQCKGGCTWTSSVLFGRPGNNPYCHHRVLDFQARGLRERLVQRESAPGNAFDYGLWDLIVEELQPREAGPT